MRIDTKVFFRPEELGREASSIRADLFSRCRRAVPRSVTDCAFVPVRSMQMLAVITRDEIVFVDNLNYAVRDGRGGRLIMLAWDLSRGGQRDSINEPVPIVIVYFHDNTDNLHARLMSEFAPALDRFEKSAHDAVGPENRSLLILLRISGCRVYYQVVIFHTMIPEISHGLSRKI